MKNEYESQDLAVIGGLASFEFKKIKKSKLKPIFPLEMAFKCDDELEFATRQLQPKKFEKLLSEGGDIFTFSRRDIMEATKLTYDIKNNNVV